MIPVIETRRLVLRPWRDEDFEPWYEMNADPRVMEFFPSTYDREKADSVAARLRETSERNEYGWWIVDVKDGASFAGTVALADVPFEAAFTPVREVGWRLPANFWSHGYATEAARALLDYAFATLGWDELVAMTAVPNVRSQRVMQRLRMTRDAAADFDHPHIEEGHPLRRHVLYRIHRQQPRAL